MIVCPVCEHPQAQGTSCDNCGKQLVAAQPVAVVAAPMAELELTQHADGAPAIPVQTMADLEVTRLRTGPDLPAQAFAELERHQTAPVAALPLEAVPELDRGREQDDGVRTAAPVGAVPCRYCRHVQASGLFCDSCGMRLPKVPAPAASAKGAAASDGPLLVICGCGAKAFPGTRCGSCGAKIPASA